MQQQHYTPKYAAEMAADGDLRMVASGVQMSAGLASLDVAESRAVTLIEWMGPEYTPIEMNGEWEMDPGVKRPKQDDVLGAYESVGYSEYGPRMDPALVLDTQDLVVYSDFGRGAHKLERVEGFPIPVFVTPLPMDQFAVVWKSKTHLRCIFFAIVIYTKDSEVFKKWPTFIKAKEVLYLAIHKHDCVLVWKDEAPGIKVSLFDYTISGTNVITRPDYGECRVLHAHVRMDDENALIFSEGSRIAFISVGRGDQKNEMYAFDFTTSVVFELAADRPSLRRFLLTAPLRSLTGIGEGRTHALAACGTRDEPGLVDLMVIENPLMPGAYLQALRDRELIPIAPLKGDRAFCLMADFEAREIVVGAHATRPSSFFNSTVMHKVQMHTASESGRTVTVDEYRLKLSDTIRERLEAGHAPIFPYGEEGDAARGYYIGGVKFSDDFQELFEPWDGKDLEQSFGNGDTRWVFYDVPDTPVDQNNKILEYSNDETVLSYRFRFPGQILQVVFGFPGYLLFLGVILHGRESGQMVRGKIWLDYSENGGPVHRPLADPLTDYEGQEDDVWAFPTPNPGPAAPPQDDDMVDLEGELLPPPAAAPELEDWEEQEEPGEQVPEWEELPEWEDQVGQPVPELQVQVQVQAEDGGDTTDVLDCTWVAIENDVSQFYDESDYFAVLRRGRDTPDRSSWDPKGRTIFERMPIVLAQKYGPRYMAVVVDVYGSLRLCLALTPSAASSTARFFVTMVGSIRNAQGQRELRPMDEDEFNDDPAMQETLRSVIRLSHIFERLGGDLKGVLARALSLVHLSGRTRIKSYRGKLMDAVPRTESFNSITYRDALAEYDQREAKMPKQGAQTGQPDTWKAVLGGGGQKRSATMRTARDPEVAPEDA